MNQVSFSMLVRGNIDFILLVVKIILDQMKSKSKDKHMTIKQGQFCPRHMRNNDLMKRTSGTKPFQLSKLRSHKRNSIQLLSPGIKLNLLGYKTHQELFEESKDIYLDLIINKKTIVDTHHNKILESERQNTFYIQSEDSLKQEFRSLSELPKIDPQPSEIDVIQSLQMQQGEKEVLIQEMSQTLLCKKRGKCESCLHLDNYLTQAIINHSNSQNNLPINHQLSQQKSSEKVDQNLNSEEQIIKLQLKYVKDRVDKSPFSFTNMKWRTQSQILQVDKWKQKYGGSPKLGVKKSSSLFKIVNNVATQRINKSQEKVLADKGSLKRVLELPPQKLPTLNKIIQSKGPISESQKIVQIINEDTENKYPSSVRNILLKNSGLQTKTQKKNNIFTNISLKKIKIKEVSIEKYQQGPKKESNILPERTEKEADLPPKKGTSQNDPEQDCEKVQKVKVEKLLKEKVKKVKFPSIQGASLKSPQQLQEEKKKEMGSNHFKIEYSWKQKLTRKAYLQRMMEEIPERWQYGESRDNSREVDAYLKIKEEQKKIEQQIRQEQQRRELEGLLEEENQSLQIKMVENIQQIKNVID